VSGEMPGRAQEPWRAAWDAWRTVGGFGPAPDTGDTEVDGRWREAWTAAAQAGHEAIAAQEPQPALAAMAPAVVRPFLGDVIILAVGDSGDESARELQDTLAALNQGTPVVTVRGVEALRTWTPPPAPTLTHTREDVIASFNAGYVAAVEKHAKPEPGLAAASTPPDVRPRADGRHGLDVTCGSCGEDYGTNVTDLDEIECAECGARRCPHCQKWFGGRS
jgi:hypothetical protein